jgi:hypothetical protein
MKTMHIERLIQSIIKVLLRTLCAWRERMGADRQLGPTTEHFADNARVFGGEIEEVQVVEGKGEMAETFQRPL